MRYRPVTVCLVQKVLVPEGTKFTLRDVIEGKVKTTKGHWEACSNLLGKCGHKHRSAEAAEPCRERMQELWNKRRVKQARAAGKASARSRAAKREAELDRLRNFKAVYGG
jgi:hypothetical protein